MNRKPKRDEPPPLTHAKELLANQAARLITMALQFIVAPIIASMVGPSSYGLIGLYMTLVALLNFVTQGPASIASRALATLNTLDESQALETGSTLRILEYITAAAGVATCILLFAALPWAVDHWLGDATGDHHTSMRIGALIVVSIAAQWMHPFYTSVYSAIRAQRTLAAAITVFAFTQNLGVLALLYLTGPHIEYYFIWNSIVWALLNFYCYRESQVLIPGRPALSEANKATLRYYGRFGLGMSLYALLQSSASQIDKLLVSYLATLSDMAAYVMSFSLSSLIMTLAATPVGAVLLPILSRHSTNRDWAALATEYLRWTQVLALLSVPPAATMIVFSDTIAGAWIGWTSPLTPMVAKLLPWSAASAVLLALMSAPLLLQWANGWLRLSIVRTAISLPIYVACLCWSIPRYGPFGGAILCLIVQAAALAIEVPILHTRLLKGLMWRWLNQGVLLPIALTIFLYVPILQLLPSTTSHLALTFIGALLLGTNYAVLTAVLPAPRATAIGLIERVSTRLKGKFH